MITALNLTIDTDGTVTVQTGERLRADQVVQLAHQLSDAALDVAEDAACWQGVMIDAWRR